MAIYAGIGGKLMSIYPKMRRRVLVFGFLTNFIAFILLYYLPNTQLPSGYHYFVISLFLCSISVGLGSYYCGVLPCIANVVEENVLGLAWGVLGTAIAFAGLAAPSIYSFIVSLNEDDLVVGYSNMVLCGMCFSWAALISSLFMYFQPHGIFDITFK